MYLEPQQPPHPGVCNRGCCWTPYGCGRNKICRCHPVEWAAYVELKGTTDE